MVWVVKLGGRGPWGVLRNGNVAILLRMSLILLEKRTLHELIKATWWTGLDKLFAEVDLDASDVDIPETEGELLTDARGDLGVPEGLGAKEAVEIGSVAGNELLLGGGGHGYD
ncbi:hypothetical protein D8674_000812 [Pyrus ussuriensis x Pyrus communis]|uniref:Uncharacterized protein n=1 Tax=Pyrus ussuriensis x Pyrus communis TaxID=2448454 RepID=A0A5N5F9I9_9ROSA|nr:hypothetical protein D8674_000812 [Pyrus ussuriensis x Pyrus communis]